MLCKRKRIAQARSLSLQHFLECVINKIGCFYYSFFPLKHPVQKSNKMQCNEMKTTNPRFTVGLLLAHFKLSVISHESQTLHSSTVWHSDSIEKHCNALYECMCSRCCRPSMNHNQCQHLQSSESSESL